MLAVRPLAPAVHLATLQLVTMDTVSVAGRHFGVHSLAMLHQVNFTGNKSGAVCARV